MVLLICDDQKSVHTFLTNSISWTLLSIDKVLHANNGSQCLEILLKEHPDILLLDIRMPHMTGIDILKQMSGLQLHTTTIILSAYSDFSYAKEALKLGAFDYELKPIDSERLTNVLTGALKLQKVNYISLLNKMLSGNKNLDVCPIPDFFSRLGINRFIGLLSVLPENSSVKHRLQLREYLQECYKYTVPLNDLELFVIYPIENSGSKQLLSSISEQYKELLLLLPSSDLKFSVSTPGTEPEFLQESLFQCRKALHEEFYSSSGFFVFRNHKPSISLKSSLLSYRHRLYTCLTNAAEKERIPKILDEIFTLFSDQRVEFDEVTDLCFDLLYYNISVILNQNAEFELELRKNMKKCKTINELRKLMEVTLWLRFFSKSSAVIEKTPIQNVHSFLESNFTSNISLDELSKKFYISKYALCRGFRQEYDEGLWDYLKRLRMEHARILLTSTDSKIYEVAEQCGFSDANYFSSTYRKYYGYTPFQEKKNIDL